MTKKADTKRPRRSDFKGLKAVLVRLEDRQDQALTEVALRRAKAKGTAKADKSEIVREELDLHPELKKTKP